APRPRGFVQATKRSPRRAIQSPCLVRLEPVPPEEVMGRVAPVVVGGQHGEVGGAVGAPIQVVALAYHPLEPAFGLMQGQVTLSLLENGPRLGLEKLNLLVDEGQLRVRLMGYLAGG